MAVGVSYQTWTSVENMQIASSLLSICSKMEFIAFSYPLSAFLSATYGMVKICGLRLSRVPMYVVMVHHD